MPRAIRSIRFVFRNQEHDLGDSNQDGTKDGIIEVTSPDPGRALDHRPGGRLSLPAGTFDHLNAFKISPLRGIRHTAPYFHDNSAKTLEAVAEHYRQFFLIVTDVDGPGGAPAAGGPHGAGQEGYRRIPEASGND